MPACGSTDLPLSDRGAAWDAGAAAASLNQPEDFQRAFFWRDPNGPPDQIGSYKLPFARREGGQLVAVWRGVTAGAARLSQTEGVDVSAVQAKMNVYYDKAEEKYNDTSIEPPWSENEAGEGEGSSDRSAPATPDYERRSAPLEAVDFDMQDDDTLRFSGLAAVFDSWSEELGGFREKIQRGAFRKALRGNPDVRLLINHNPDLVVARSTVPTGPGSLRLEEETGGLRVSAELAPTTAAKDLRTLVASGVVSQMSFGFTMRGGKDAWNDDYTERTLVEIGDVFDVSSVTYPAYPATTATMRSIACGIEVVDQEGVVQEDLLDVLAARIHRGATFATAEERARLDAAFARVHRLSPWMEELARRALGVESAGITASSTNVDGVGGAQTSVASPRRSAAARKIRMATLRKGRV